MFSSSCCFCACSLWGTWGTALGSALLCVGAGTASMTIDVHWVGLGVKVRVKIHAGDAAMCILATYGTNMNQFWLLVANNCVQKTSAFFNVCQFSNTFQFYKHFICVSNGMKSTKQIV